MCTSETGGGFRARAGRGGGSVRTRRLPFHMARLIFRVNRTWNRMFGSPFGCRAQYLGFPGVPGDTRPYITPRTLAWTSQTERSLEITTVHNNNTNTRCENRPPQPHRRIVSPTSRPATRTEFPIVAHTHTRSRYVLSCPMKPCLSLIGALKMHAVRAHRHTRTRSARQWSGGKHVGLL